MNGKQTKWLKRLLVSKPRTPLPPKPYVDASASFNELFDERYIDPTKLENVPSQKPHWSDARYESRQTVPFFDLFGFNRNWSWTLYKGTIVILVIWVYCMLWKIFAEKEKALQFECTTYISAAPDYARDDKATEKELREAEFSYIGTSKLDNLGVKSPSSNV